jgi:hypothetical protein
MKTNMKTNMKIKIEAMRDGSRNLTAIRAAVFAGLLGLAMAAQAGEAFLENFKTGWSNDTDTNQLGPNGTYPPNWLFRTDASKIWSVVDSGGPQGKVLQFKGGSFCNDWWPTGSEHGVVYSPGKIVQLDGWIREATPTSAFDLAYLWLSTPEHNGYGFLVCRSNGYESRGQLEDNTNFTSIFKYRGCTVKFGESGTANWQIPHGDRPGALVEVEAASDEYLHFFLRLKQKAPGSPVEIALYYNSTSKPPVMTWTDDGTLFGPIFDIESLTWVGVTAENGKDIPNPIQFGAIGVSLVQKLQP